MSDVENQATSILLPEAKVAVYSADKATLDSANKAKEDWRFARVHLAVEEGDVETATAFYEDQPSPDLIIVQTDTIDETLTGKLERLAGNCDEDTAAIVIGPVNDVYLYRNLIEMGVSDYLVKPIAPSAMAEVIAKTLIERLGVSNSRLIAFVGAKGGVGVSALAQGAASGIADILGQKTILLDCSGGWSTMNVNFGFEPSTTLSEAAATSADGDEDSLDRMLFRASDHLSILASGSDIMLEPAVIPHDLENLLDKFLLKFPVMVVDLSHASPEISKTVLSRANQVIVVSTPFLPSLRLTRALIQEVKDIRGGDENEIELIINMQGLDRVNEVPEKDIEQAIEMKISSVVSFSGKAFLKLESAGKTLISNQDGRQIISEKLLPVINKILSIDSKKKTGDGGGLLGRVLGQLKAK